MFLHCIFYYTYYCIFHYTCQGYFLNRQALPHAQCPIPYPGIGIALLPRQFFRPFRRYAFTLSPYRYGSFPRTIPHSIKSAAAPVTKGAAKEVPVTGA